MEPFFSVIIPVYKVQNYLHQCVDSVLAQSFQAYEIILVDDGSPDRCPQICDEYAARYGNIAVIHQPNGGLSVARNSGIRAAKGAYLIFLDSDDYWDDPDALAKIQSTIAQTGTDIVMWWRKIYREATGTVSQIVKSYPTLKNGMPLREKILRLLSLDMLEISSCLKAVRREIVTENDILFMENRTTEDILFSTQVYENADSLEILPSDFYVYRIRPSSITNTIGRKNLEDYLFILSECFRVIDAGRSELREPLMGYLAYQYLLLCAHIGKSAKGEDKKAMLEEAKKLGKLGIMRCRVHPKVKQAGWIYDLSGCRGLAFALGLYLWTVGLQTGLTWRTPKLRGKI